MRWTSLRDSFKRQLKADLQVASGAAATHRKKIYGFYESLMFLKDTLAMRR